MGVFRTKFVTENVEQYRETGEREGEAQNTTLHAKFSKKPSIDSREPQGSVSNFYERTENVEQHRTTFTARKSHNFSGSRKHN
mgnify:CR=1 FL=1